MPLKRYKAIGFPSVLAHNSQLMGRTGEGLEAILADDAKVLQANAEPTREVDAGLYRDDRTFRYRLVVETPKTWLLVNLEAHAVTQAMIEVLPIARVRDDLDGKLMDISPLAAGLQGDGTGLVRKPDDIVHPPLFLSLIHI